MSHEIIDIPADFGTHHCLNSSGVLHASKTMCAGASNVQAEAVARLVAVANAFQAMADKIYSSQISIALDPPDDALATAVHAAFRLAQAFKMPRHQRYAGAGVITTVERRHR